MDKAQEFAEFARLLQAAGTSQQTLQKLVDLAPETIPGCDYAGVSMVTGDHVDTPAASGLIPRQVDRIQYESGEGPCLDAIRHHEVFVTDDLASEVRWPNFAGRAASETGVRSMLSFRLFVERDTLGSLNLYSKAVSAFGAESRAAGAVFAAHAAVAVKMAREHDRAQRLQADLTTSERDASQNAEQAEVAGELQRSMLPALPAVTGFELEVRYVSAVAAAQVGGDWYDAFALPQGGTALVIGDVAGHDIDAAIRMGQLRSTLRALAVDRGEPPADVLRRVDNIASHLDIMNTATCVYAVVENSIDSGWQVNFANAGHPAPLLVTAEGDVSYLETVEHLMLGLGGDTPRSSVTLDLPSGSTFLMYTDGLVEYRGRSITDGLANLEDLAQSLSREPLARFCDALIDELAAQPGDDVCLLALRIPTQDS